MKKVIPLMLAVVLTACGPSETPKQADVPTVEELASDPARASKSCANSAEPIAPRWATCCATGWPKPRASGFMVMETHLIRRRRTRPSSNCKRFATNC